MGFHKRYIDDDQIIDMYENQGYQAIIDWYTKGVDALILSGPLSERIGNGPSFAFPFFEITKLGKRRINHLKSVDGIMVSSTWAKNVIKEAQEMKTPAAKSTTEETTEEN